jgi:hypothetical protein
MAGTDVATCFEDGDSIMINTSLSSFPDHQQNYCGGNKQRQLELCNYSRSHTASLRCCQTLDAICNPVQQTGLIHGLESVLFFSIILFINF